MRKVWAVIRREFIERVRSRWFIISTVLGPLFMLAITILPSLLTMRGGRNARIVIVNSHADSMAVQIRERLTHSGRFQIIEIRNVPEDQISSAESSLARQVQTDSLDGFLAVTSATVETGMAEYRARNVSSLADIAILENVLRQAVLRERLSRHNIPIGV